MFKNLLEKIKAWLATTKLKSLWDKIKDWWETSKIKPIFNKIGKSIRQFLRYAYAAQISYLVLAVLFYLTTSKLLGALLIAWGVVLLVAEYRQQKAEKSTELNPQPEPPAPVEELVKVSKPRAKKITK